MKSIVLSFITEMNLNDPENYKRFLSSLWDQHKLICPTHVNSYEPINNKVNKPEDSFAYWGNPFFWKRKLTPKVLGSIFPADDSSDMSWICIDIEKINLKKLNSIIDIFIQISQQLDVYISTIHLNGKSDFSNGTVFRSKEYCLLRGFPPIELVNGIPDLSWGTIMSSKLSKDFIPTSTPPKPIIVSELGKHKFLKLTEDPLDSINKEGCNIAVRSIGKSWIGNEKFWK